MSAYVGKADRSAVHQLLRATDPSSGRTPGGPERKPSASSLCAAGPSLAARPSARAGKIESAPRPPANDETLIRGAEGIITDVREGVGQLRDALGIDSAANDDLSRAIDSFQNAVKRTTLDQRSGGIDAEALEQRFTGAFAELSETLGAIVAGLETPDSKPVPPAGRPDVGRTTAPTRASSPTTSRTEGDALTPADALDALTSAFEQGLSSLLSALGGGLDVTA